MNIFTGEAGVHSCVLSTLDLWLLNVELFDGNESFKPLVELLCIRFVSPFFLCKIFDISF